MTSTAAKRLALPLAVTALAWWYTVAHSPTMPMQMGERADLLSLIAMGSIMMIAMMLPAAIPWIIEAGTGFAAGYGLIWMAFGAAMAVAQWQFGNPPPVAAAAIAIAALFYERTSLKQLFLRTCASTHVAATRESFKLGAQQGMRCVGCCWLLMVAIFALGATNLALMLLVTTYVVAQRLLAFYKQRQRACSTALRNQAVQTIAGRYSR